MNRPTSMSFVVLLVLCYLGASSAQTKLCGTVLSDALYQVCRGNFNTIFDKRSSPNVNFDPLNPIQYTEDMALPTESSYPLANMRMPHFYQEDALSSLSAVHRRIRAGIVYECCNQGCTFKKLEKYCLADPN